MDPEDQVQSQEDSGSEEIVETTDNQETQDNIEQSDVASESEEIVEGLLKLPDGRELSGEQVLNEYTKLNSEFTRRSQELAALKKEQEARGQEVEKRVSAMDENPLLKDVPPDVKEAIRGLTEPLIQEALQKIDQDRVQKETDRAFQASLDKLERQYNGKNGLPKFDREKILEGMADPNNKVYDPEAFFLINNREPIRDYEIKQYLKNKAKPTLTENTGSGEPRTPQTNTPSSWDEASRSAASRFQ